MMRHPTLWGLAMMLLVGGCSSSQTTSEQHFYDLNQQRPTASDQAFEYLKQSKIVLVGEQHTTEAHHIQQLYVIQRLHQAGRKVAVGLEMFRRDSQADLDRWVAGELSGTQFEAVYYDNWNYDYELYRPIFEYARQNGIDLIGLNVPRGITRQVARQGFKSLSEAQRGKVSNVVCDVDQSYMDYIKRSHGAHAHGNFNFTYFCEAQMLWDAAMAVHALDYLAKNPDAVVVILAGVGHVHKMAIPTQIRQRTDLPMAVILPAVPGDIDPQTVTVKDADFIITEKSLTGF